MSTEKVRADIKPYTKKQLAILYEVTPRCFTTMVDKFKSLVGEKKGWYYNVKQVEIIFDKLGYPNAFLPDDLPEEVKEKKKDIWEKNENKQMIVAS